MKIKILIIRSYILELEFESVQKDETFSVVNFIHEKEKCNLLYTFINNSFAKVHRSIYIHIK